MKDKTVKERKSLGKYINTAWTRLQKMTFSDLGATIIMLFPYA